MEMLPYIFLPDLKLHSIIASTNLETQMDKSRQINYCTEHLNAPFC